METKIVRNPEKIKQQLGMFAAVFISAKVLRDGLNRDVDDFTNRRARSQRARWSDSWRSANFMQLFQFNSRFYARDVQVV